MISSNEAIILTLRIGEWAEGYREHMYKCSEGYNTIGIGFNVDAGMPYHLAKRVQVWFVAQALVHLEMEPYWPHLDPIRQAALLDMCFQMGWPKFSGFKKMRRALRRATGTMLAGEGRNCVMNPFEYYIEWAATEATDSKWYRQSGRRGPVIVDMIRTGREPAL